MQSKRLWRVTLFWVCCIAYPTLMQAQSVGNEVEKLHTVLENLFNEMMPLCAQFITIARAIGGFGATFYIGVRVWRHIANAEAIDFFPLFRPFVLAILIGMFPTVLAIMNGILKPTVTVSAGMVNNSNDAIKKLITEREAAIKLTKKWQVLIGPTGMGDRKEWYKYTHPGSDASDEGFFEGVGNDFVFAWQQIWYNIKYFIKLVVSFLLEMLYYAASLCIDTIRTFHLVVLSILGPLVFALAIYDGFQHTLSVWLARYINIYMWLPCANIFGSILGKVQENMIKIDIGQLQTNEDTFFTSTDIAYLIFMVIGIVGYFTVPSVANYIVHASGANTLLSKTNSLVSSSMQTSSGAMNTLSSSGSYASDMRGPDRLSAALADAANSESYNKEGSGNNYQHGKLSG